MTTGRGASAGRIVLLGGAVALAAALAGCSIPLSDMPLIGSSEAEAKAKPVDEFPAVNDLPAARDTTALEPAERARIESELVAARERQAAAAARSPATK